MKIQDYIADISIDEFWQIVDSLPDEIDGKKHKKNINAFFHKNGEAKKSAEKISEDSEELQEWIVTHRFIMKSVRRQLHMKALSDHKAKRKEEIRKFKQESTKDERRKVRRNGSS